MNNTMTPISHLEVVEELICPVCGYYCLGKGGFGCIDKLGLFELADANDK